MQMEEEEQHKACTFHAQPATVLQELLFEPQHSKRSSTSLYHKLCSSIVEIAVKPMCLSKLVSKMMICMAH